MNDVIISVTAIAYCHQLNVCLTNLKPTEYKFYRFYGCLANRSNFLALQKDFRKQSPK